MGVLIFVFFFSIICYCFFFLAQKDLESDDIDALDAFMKSIKGGAMDTKTRIKLKRELFDLQKELKRVERLMQAAKPVLPALQV